jgi:CDP-glucose 4,6-dehydratase
MENLVDRSPLGLTADRAEFWAGKRMLVTGHTGFKGSWLVLWLQHLGAEVIGYSLDPPSTPNLFETAQLGETMVSIHGDVRSPEALLRVMRDHRPEVVLHLAAQSLVRASYDQPTDTYATNVMGTVHVLDAIRQVASVRAAVMVTSDKCYENPESPLWGFRETDPMGGLDPYSNSKGCAELVVSAYQRSFFADASRRVGVGSARAGNVIGGGDWADDRLLPDVVRAFSNEEPVHIRNPQAVRPWQHVLEPLRGYLTLAQALWADPDRFAGGWNFGPDDADAQPVGAIVDRLISLWGDGAEAAVAPGPHPHEASFLRLDCSKARSGLGWTPRVPLAEALRWTVEWYKSVDEGADPRSLTLDQIRRYEHLLQDSVSHDFHQGSPSGYVSPSSRAD